MRQPAQQPQTRRPPRPAARASGCDRPAPRPAPRPQAQAQARRRHSPAPSSVISISCGIGSVSTGRSGPNQGSSSARCSPGQRAGRGDAGRRLQHVQHGRGLRRHLSGGAEMRHRRGPRQRVATSGRPAAPWPATGPARRPRETPSPPAVKSVSRAVKPVGGTTRSACGRPAVRRRQQAECRALSQVRPRQLQAPVARSAAPGAGTCDLAARIRFRSWVAISIVLPIRFSSTSSVSRRSDISQSTLPVGSSARITSGDMITARASAAR